MRQAKIPWTRENREQLPDARQARQRPEPLVVPILFADPRVPFATFDLEMLDGVNSVSVSCAAVSLAVI